MRKVILTFVLLGFFIAIPASAALPTLIPKACTGKAYVNKDAMQKAIIAGDKSCTDEKTCICDLSAVEQMAVNLAQIILGVAGSLALLAFVAGGIMFTASGGRSQLISKGVSTMKYAFIGIAIILLSGVAIKLLLNVLAGNA